MRQFTRAENLLWSSDYPHDRSTWPRSRELLDELFEGVPKEERRMMAGDNARRLYEMA